MLERRHLAARPNVVVVVPPKEFIALDRVKNFCKVDGRRDNDLLEILRDAAVASADGPHGWLNRCLAPQTLELSQWGFGSWDQGGLGWGFRYDCAGRIRLPFPEIINVVSVKYDDAQGLEQTLAPDQYVLRGRVLMPAPGKSWPATFNWEEAVRIRYRAGFIAPDADPLAEDLKPAVPKDIVAAILIMVGGLYVNRQDLVISTTGAVGSVKNSAADNALMRFRVME